MNGTLVCGVEATESGRHAVAMAVDVSKRLDVRLVLVNVVHVPGRMGVQHDDEIFWRDRRGASAMLKELAREFEVADCAEQRVVVGDAAEALARIAAEEAADLIVIGGRQPGGFGRRGRSRFAEQLACETPIPVLVAMQRKRSIDRKRDAPPIAI